MQLTDKDLLFVLTGAGVSAESGLATFRGADGLWNGYRVEEVATPEAWEDKPTPGLGVLLHAPARRPEG